MLSIFRRGVTAKIMLVILGIGLFAIVITGFGTGGVGGIGSLGAGGSVASVDGEAIPASEVNDQIKRQLDRARQQRPELDIVNFLRGGAFEEVVSQIITSTAMKLFGREVGLAASEEAVSREIAGIDAFKNFAGQFDRATFLQALQREGVTEQKLREEIAGLIIQRQLLVPVAESPYVPQSIALQYASLLLESRSGTVGLVPSAAMGGGKEPTDQELATFYQQNQNRYVVPERRVLRYAFVGPEMVAAAARATDADIAAEYKANAAAYAPSSTRDLTQVIVADEALARRIAAQASGGTPLAQAASAAKLSPIQLTAQTREGFQRVSSPAVAQAAFAAAQGAVAGPARSGLGWHVVKVDKVTATPGRPLAAVRAELAQRVEERKAQEALQDLSSRIDTAIGDGATFDELVKSEKLAAMQTVAITATGTAPGNPGWQLPPDLAPLLRAGFDIDPENPEPVLEQVGQRFALVALGPVNPAAAAPLAQIRERVKADLVARRAADRARAVATALVAKINAGTPPAQAFAEAQVKLSAPQTVTARRVDIAQQGANVPAPLAMLFNIPRGKARLLPAPNGQGWFVVHLNSVTPGDASNVPQLVAATAGQFREVVGGEYAEQFTRAIQAQMKVKRDEDALAKLKQSLQGNGGN
jgi:peptidyl-prolyl cis-trans isomerase D